MFILFIDWFGCANISYFHFSGRCVYEKGCRCSNPELPKSSIKTTMSPSQCHTACIMASISCWEHEKFCILGMWIMIVVISCYLLGWYRNGWSICTDDTPTSAFGRFLPWRKNTYWKFCASICYCAKQLQDIRETSGLGSDERIASNH